MGLRLDRVALGVLVSSNQFDRGICDMIRQVDLDINAPWLDILVEVIMYALYLLAIALGSFELFCAY